MADKNANPLSKAPPAADEKSIRQLPRLNINEDDNSGEMLQECSDQEWNTSEEPYSAELLNVKKKPNKVSVFAAPVKKDDAFRGASSVREKVTKVSAQEDRAKYIARLMQKVTDVLLENEDANGVEVRVSMVFRDGNTVHLSDKK